MDQRLHLKCTIVKKRYTVLVNLCVCLMCMQRAAGFSVHCSVSMTTPHNPSHAPNFLQHTSVVSFCIEYRVYLFSKQ